MLRSPDERLADSAGIAAPESFERLPPRHRGAKLIYTRRFLDHYRFTQEDLDGVFDEAKKAGVELLITTEKDAVRIESVRKSAVPCYGIPAPEIEILRGEPIDFQDPRGEDLFSQWGNR